MAYCLGHSGLRDRYGGVVVTPDFLDQLNLTGNASLISTVTAIYDIGCFFGAISVCAIGDPLGRKKCVLLGTTIMSIGAILQIASFGVPQMIVGRIIAGIGNGINTSTAPVWQGETSRASWRGKLIVIEMIMNIAGFSLSNWVTYGFSFVAGSASWRVPLAFQFLFIFVLFATVPWLPESPRWLMAKGRVDEAERILADLEATDLDDPYIITQSKDIQWAVQYEKDHAVRWRDLLRGRTGDQAGTHTIRRVILGMGTQAMQQLIFNFMVVEITPPGIRSLGWRFYIIWCVFNFAFIPTVYFFYPETAGRTLEDLDRYFAGDAPLLVFRDKEVIASKRPEKFIENEKAEIRRHSSVVAGDVQAANAAYQRKSRTEGAEFHEDV
ncbi:hypothetical protein SLS59_009503 [Nothophoma quercina]|uniref:Major facilitator superfamily (MFS) profile domain-containing protein n=1 Tax=Nothophoma quercina TaxID=749835 RepID=A0ABR3QLL1_9PLEO